MMYLARFDEDLDANCAAQLYNSQSELLMTVAILELVYKQDDQARINVNFQ
jgi:hypothetical protein